MPSNPNIGTPPKPRAKRSDGAETREQILQTAGQLFANKGYRGTTSKEICTSAGTNMAAVNYHFGDKDGLYGAVLVAAHGQLMQLTDLEHIQQSNQSHEEKLRALIGLFVYHSMRSPQSWGLTVLVREMMAPSGQLPTLFKAAVLPKMAVIRSLIAQVLDLPVDHPAVRRGMSLVVPPCILAVVAPKELLGQLMPELASAPEAIVEDMAAYALAGLSVLKQRTEVIAKRH